MTTVSVTLPMVSFAVHIVEMSRELADRVSSGQSSLRFLTICGGSPVDLPTRLEFLTATNMVVIAPEVRSAHL